MFTYLFLIFESLFLDFKYALKAQNIRNNITKMNLTRLLHNCSNMSVFYMSKLQPSLIFMDFFFKYFCLSFIVSRDFIMDTILLLFECGMTLIRSLSDHRQ